MLGSCRYIHYTVSVVLLGRAPGRLYEASDALEESHIPADASPLAPCVAISARQRQQRRTPHSSAASRQADIA
eukprot:6195229-Pleurochrysis_carterae.AAC.1